MKTKKSAARSLSVAIVRRPGNGWTWLSSSVWEHTSGARIHCLGRVRMADGNSRTWTWEEEYRFKRITGGNTKRALMLCALSLLPPNIGDELHGRSPKTHE